MHTPVQARLSKPTRPGRDRSTAYTHSAQTRGIGWAHPLATDLQGVSRTMVSPTILAQSMHNQPCFPMVVAESMQQPYVFLWFCTVLEHTICFPVVLTMTMQKILTCQWAFETAPREVVGPAGALRPDRGARRFLRFVIEFGHHGPPPTPGEGVGARCKAHRDRPPPDSQKQFEALFDICGHWAQDCFEHT